MRKVLLSTALLSAALCVTQALTRHSSVHAATSSSNPAAVRPLDNPDQACAQCHRAIYDRYEKTAMARDSGIAANALLPAAFHHQASDIDYRVFLRDTAAWMSYSRPATHAKGELNGEQQLLYYIGSGRHGRTYLYQQSSQWFEMPINYYTPRSDWEMTPAYENATSLPAPLPVDPNCLHCHATDVQPSLPTAHNRFATTPFRQGGIGCSACHGDPSQHLAQHGHGPIVNPAKLTPTRRDSSCVQCHLEGNAVVYRPGKSLAQFRPGDDLADFAVYFVRSHEPGDGRRATSQYEALLRSACKRASGDKLTCTTCHDPHSDPAPAERVQFYRQRCLACHNTPSMATHHAEQQDCATCHMTSRDATDISHEQVTDHDIESRPTAHSTLRSLEADTSRELVPVGDVPAGDREYGLAYAQLASRGDQKAGERALQLLTKASLAGANDLAVNTRLGYLQQIAGQPDKARASYSAALNSDPYEPTALANLAVLDATFGHAVESVHLLERLINSDPSQTAAGLNLAYIDCKLGRSAQARGLLAQLQAANPDDPLLRNFLRSGNYAGQHCDMPPTK
jgi:predicted CXXCH cytochrome family protein